MFMNNSLIGRLILKVQGCKLLVFPSINAYLLHFYGKRWFRYSMIWHGFSIVSYIWYGDWS